ncbi:nickel insertion protein [Paenibacillus chungangensis]|uniref:Nickel insertion protein n=1 Tax=Paenibacillus chungangensis TaxID=696535 RepID=A0ABW3HX02_9BACL
MASTRIDNGHGKDEMVHVQTNIDDMNPELCPYVGEKLMAAGAHDVYWIPIIMKKGRPGLLLNVLTRNSLLAAIETVIFEETTTLGLRYMKTDCKGLERYIEQVDTPWGAIAVKVGRHNGKVVQFSPEYADCEAAARNNGIPLKDVYEVARRSYVTE